MVEATLNTIESIPYANKSTQVRQTNRQKVSDDKEYVSYQEVFGDLESVTFTFKEALEFMEISEEKFRELLSAERKLSNSLHSEEFPALFLKELKQKIRDSNGRIKLEYKI